jgi:membrane protein required for colicin V production
MNFEVIDIVFALLMVILIIRAALRGFIEELMSMASWVLGFGAAFFLHKNGALFIRERYLPEMTVLPEILAFIAIFLIVFVAVKILEFILRDIVTRINLGGVDRFLGVLFGLIEGILLVSLILFLFTLQPLFDAGPLLENSVFARLFTRYLLPFIAVVGDSLGRPGGG